MHGTRRLTDQELDEIQRRRPAARASLACEGMYLSRDDEALIEAMDRDRILPQERIARIKDVIRAAMQAKAAVAG
jgi:hypothetical protein